LQYTDQKKLEMQDSDQLLISFGPKQLFPIVRKKQAK